MINESRHDNPDASSVSVTIPIHQEEVRVGRRTTDTGKGVRVHKTVTERPHALQETLLHDDVEIRHVPVDRIVAISETPAVRQDGDTLIVPVMEEILVVEKRVRIKEELHVTKKRHEEHRRETITLKAETVSIERFDEGREAEK